MKTNLLYLLLLLPQLLLGQTSGIGYPQYWETKPSGEVIYYRVQRNYTTYPASTSNAAFDSYVQGCVDCKIPRVSLYDWTGNVRVTYVADSSFLEVESNSSANLQLSFSRYDGVALVGKSRDGVPVTSGSFYGSGPSNYGKIWTFGKAGSTGGIPQNTAIRLTFKNVSTGATYSHVFTTIHRASQSALFLAGGNSSPPTGGSGPTWLASRYSYNATTAQITLESSGDDAQLKIERVDGNALLLANNDNPVLSSGVFYGSGGLSGQGDYNKQWVFGKRSGDVGGVPTVPIKLTWKRNSTQETYVVTLTPANVTRQQLFTSGGGSSASCNFTVTTAPQSVGCGAAMTLSASVSGSDAGGVTFTWSGNGFSANGQSVNTTSPTGNGTYAYVVTASKNGCTAKTANAVIQVTGCGQSISYNKVLFFGNSITHHGPTDGWYSNTRNWGMDASAADKDYFHITTNYLKTLNPSVQTKEIADFSWQGGQISVADGPYWESAYWNLSGWQGGLEYLNNVADYQPDLIVIRIGENVADDSHDFVANTKALINKLKSKKPNAKVIITGSVWYAVGNQAAVSAKLQQVANEEGYTYVDLSGISGARDGYGAHPNDAAMQTIADRIWAAIPKGTTGGNAPAQMAGGFGEGSVTSLMAYAPFVPTNNQINEWPQGCTTQYVVKGGLKFGILKCIGASLTHLSRDGGENLINTYSVGDPAKPFETTSNPPDGGRSMGISTYGQPRSAYQENGQSTANCPTGDVGKNPVQGGSFYGDHSPILFYERRNIAGYGDVLYTKVQPYEWGLNNVLSQNFYHSWYWIEGEGASAVMRYFYIIEFNRSDNQRNYRESAQELPFVYTIGTHYRYVMYTGNAPKTGGALTDITPPVPGPGSTPAYQEDTGSITGSENWIGSTKDDGTGVFLVPPYNTRFHGKQFVSRSGDEFSLTASYVNASLLYNTDQNHVAAFSGYVYAGSTANFRNWYNNAQIPAMPFDFKFTAGKMCGWAASSSPGYLDGSNQFVWNIGHKRAEDQESWHGRLRSPYNSWRSSDLNTIYIKGVWSPGVNEIRLDWQKPNQTDSQAENQYKHITVNGTGNMQTLVVNMAGYTSPDGGSWDNSIITNISLTSKKYPNNPVYSGNETFKPVYIGTVNPN